MAADTRKEPSEEELDEFLMACRFGDLDDVKAFVDAFGSETIGAIRDESGNTPLHMICANGHDDLLEYILPFVPPDALGAQNQSGSTPLHWAAMNQQLEVSKRLVQYSPGPRQNLIDIKNAAGRTPLGEAEMANWDEGASWMVSVMNLEETSASANAVDGLKAQGLSDSEAEAGQDVDEHDGVTGEELVDENGQPLDLHLEVEDAEGKVASLSIRADSKNESSRQ